MLFRTYRFLICITVATGLLAGLGMNSRLHAESDKGQPRSHDAESRLQIDGIYPHLVLTRSGRGEFAHGAIVPWADRLWILGYVAPDGHTLWDIDNELNMRRHPNSLGGCYAGRMIHPETNQLIMGPHIIDVAGEVSVIDGVSDRVSAVMRHLSKPESHIYLYGMEGSFYEVDLDKKKASLLFKSPAPGAHGKGGYTGQGRVVISNNGAALGAAWHPYDETQKTNTPGRRGALAEWDGKEWRVVHESQFCDVTGPGGIHGSPDDQSPIWAIGWDDRSLILKVLAEGEWSTWRLPKGTYTFDSDHGHYTEWPRIREVAPGKLMMDMHGMFFQFPSNFVPAQTGGLRPISRHLRFIPDWCHWNDKLVLGSDDTNVWYVNPVLGGSVPQSNLMFTTPEEIARWGQPAGWGGVWLNDEVKTQEPSDPFLVAGFDKRVLHLSHHHDRPVKFTLEMDRDGTGHWEPYTTVEVNANGYDYHVLPADCPAVWVRLSSDTDCEATAFFHFAPDYDHSDHQSGRNKTDLITGLFSGEEAAPHSEGLVLSAGKKPRLQFAASVSGTGSDAPKSGLYELDADLKLRKISDDPSGLREKAAVETRFTVDDASIIVCDPRNSTKRYRLPKGAPEFDPDTTNGPARDLREVIVEKYMFNCYGTMFEVPFKGKLNPQPDGSIDPSRNDPDYGRMRPITTHGKAISDFCVWRGLLVLAGIRDDAEPGTHLILSDDNRARLWVGSIENLWDFGKPKGVGGPWHRSKVKAGSPSDPFLMTGYDRKRLELSHSNQKPVTFTVEVDFLADGTWHPYQTFSVKPSETLEHKFPESFNAHWVRIVADDDCEATALFTYE